MPKFSRRSNKRLDTCHPDIQKVMREIVKTFDCTVIWGHRPKAAQNQAYLAGHSTKQWPDSKHNQKPSIAIDIIPYPVDWDDRERMTLFAGHVLRQAHIMGIKLRWGGDWNQNNEVKDNRFDDLAHFELT